MPRSRDEFTEKTKSTLRARVAGRCSKPDCRIQTISANTDDTNKITNIGKAAHICAASENGPRYDETMSIEERKHINNGIWLCGNHADEIDKDLTAHPVELLKQWKIEAEKKSIEELGIDPSSSGLTGILFAFGNLLKKIGSGEIKRDRKIDEALEKTNEAVIKTQTYLSNEGAFAHTRDRDKERELAKSWYDLSVLMRHVDSELANICHLKGGYWSNIDAWDDARSEYTDISLVYVEKLVSDIFKKEA